MLKMVDGTGIIGVDTVCPLGGAVSPPQPPNFDKVEMEGVGSLTLPNSLKAPLERLELTGNSVQPTTTGKNLFDESKAVTGRINPDNGELLPETSYISSDYIEVQEGETYFQSGSGDGYYRAFYDMNKKFTSIPTKGIFKITVPVGSKFLRISGRKERFGDWMIEKGDKATPYEPYTGLKSSPSPEYPQEIKSAGKWNEGAQKYEIDVKVTGKNLFDREKARDTANWIIRDGDGYAKFPIRVGKGNKATFSYTEKLTPGKGFYLGIAQSDTGSAVGWLYHSTEINLNNNKLTVVAKGDCLYLSCNKTSIQKFFDTIQTLQVEMGSEPTPYEPYTEQTLTLTSDRPITKWDKLVEQGGSMGWLYSGKIAKEFTFVSKASDENISGRIRRRFKTSLNGKFPQTDKVMCNFLTTDNVRNDYSIGIVGSGDIYIYFYENTGVETLEQANHWLKNLPFEKTIIFERKTTEFVPLSESEQTQLRNLHSYNGTTNIMVDSGEVPCGIKLTYRKEK